MSAAHRPPHHSRTHFKKAVKPKKEKKPDDDKKCEDEQ